MKKLTIEVYGRVQGVNFRNNVKNFCDRNSIEGEVMNRDDGSVLIVAEGIAEDIERFIEWLEQNPGFSKVDNIKVKEIKNKKEYAGFDIVKEYPYLKDKARALDNLIRKL